uniref:CSON011696 protein n=1 Tax=Culicoides sonorensis TaxID=179676 RepID=A0A336LM91_CULSO
MNPNVVSFPPDTCNRLQLKCVLCYEVQIIGILWQGHDPNKHNLQHLQPMYLEIDLLTSENGGAARTIPFSRFPELSIISF